MKKLLILIPVLFLLVIPLVFADTIILKNPNSSNLADARVHSGTADTNYGNGILNIDGNAGGIFRSYLMFNLSNLTGATVYDAMVYINVSSYEGTDSFNIHEVNSSGVSWGEFDLTWNNQPCGTAFDGAQCNLTTADTVSITAIGTYKFNITGMVKKALDNGIKNVSFVLKADVEGGGSIPFDIYSKEQSAATGGIPYLNISYSPEKFTITAKDSYDNSTIYNFTVTISNSTDSFSNSTTTGSSTFTNATNGIYNISFTTIYKNGSFYFNRSYVNYNVSTDLEGQLFQSLLNLYVNDSLTGISISNFNVTTNFSSYSSTNGYILLYSKAGTRHILNVTSSLYPKQTHYYSINALENMTMTINLSPSFDFYLRREADNSVFDWNGTNTTRLTIYCPNKNIVIYFNTSSNASTLIDCSYTLMKMDVTYSASSYFRTLIPPKNQQNVTWYLLDLNLDTGVQIILELIDLVGDWASGILRVKTAIGEIDEDIIEQEFDISDAVTLYLLKDGLYTLSIENIEGAERTIGSLIADAAGTKTITYPNIPFYPEITILEDNISWSYTFNTAAQILRLQYEDTTGHTTYLRWNIYNGTNATHLLTRFTANSNSSLIFTYQPVHANNTYYTHLFVQQSDLDYNISEYKIFAEYQDYLSMFEGFENRQDLAMYVSIIFLVVWGLLFSAKHAGIGMTSTFIWVVILRTKGFLPISWLWVGLIGFVAILGWVVEAMRK